MGHSPRSGDREQLVRLYAAAVSVPVNGLHIRIEALKGLARIAIANRDERTAQNLLREGRRLAIKVNRRLDGLEFALLLGEDGQAPEFQQIDIADASELRRRSRIDPIRSPGTVMQNVSVQSGLMLTVREREILALLEQHHSNKAVARKLELGLETVKWHVANLLSKVGASDRNHAIERARALGLLRFQFSNTPL
jgi:LuxR family maltose regulon positive regulatory protein